MSITSINPSDIDHTNAAREYASYAQKDYCFGWEADWELVIGDGHTVGIEVYSRRSAPTAVYANAGIIRSTTKGTRQAICSRG